ncbi:hypothetical protein [Geobacter sp. SVR]|uniref:hypothetical protein n=1 Tax=Geobacter sp. SVR TaxID=2495594 RepID=UPI00143EF8BF|nr:hypothetical protein [Geobacter sp. SVR]BCS55195.1 hypothetical protein GSVR_35030 [Geobacter sp. SVR]GCF85996.1 hypothetical protein GSbR_25960 [Geobacter sp. SVR]
MDNREKEKNRPRLMVAPESGDSRLQPIEALAAERGMPAYAVAGMCRANGWAPGKHLTAADFEAAMEAYRNRPMSAGRR